MTNSRYSTGVLSLISMTVIGSVLFIGTTISFSLNQQKMLADAEMEQAMDTYIVLQAFNGMASGDSSLSEDMNLSGQINDICAPIALGGDGLSDVKHQKVAINKLYRCRPERHDGDGWKILSVSSAGYSGEITLAVGLEGDQTLGYLKVLNHRETPGYGDRLLNLDSKWLDTLIGRPKSFFDSSDSSKTSVTGTGLDATSGATITAQAVLNMVEQSFTTGQTSAKPAESPSDE